MKRSYLLGTAFALPFLALAGPASADCGSLTIASMNWQSAELAAALDASCWATAMAAPSR